MFVKVWGTRGSRPATENSFYGTDTACIEVCADDGSCILLDAGSGLAAFEKANPGARPPIFLSHLHLDHIQGLPFYGGTYDKSQVIYTPDDRLDALFDGILSPVRIEGVAARIHRLEPVASFQVGSILVETLPANHPGGCLAWKITADGWSLAYSGDHEMPLDKSAWSPLLPDFMAGADVVLADAHFSKKDHEAHPGWGHSHMEQWAEALAGKNVGKIIFCHLNPAYSDAEIQSLLEESRRLHPDLNLAAVYSGCVIDSQGLRRQTPDSCPACSFFKRTASLYDTHTVLNTLLTEARTLCKADAGTIYLVENNELSFAASQNDTLFPKSAANKFSYMNSRIPVSKASIAGYVAATGAFLNIPDVYELRDTEYGFNRSFDQANGYRTGSMLAVPLVNGKNKIIGVLQLINARGENGFIPFAPQMARTITELAAMATIPLERAFLITDMILRMLKTSSLRDPTETAGHVYRVGSICAELYHRWAEAHHVEPEELLAIKSQLRLAAMLHDVGKVGIPDAILKKPGKLDDEERAKMQAHAALGAGLFRDGTGAIDHMARDISLHHHAKWDGTGYTGDAAIKSPAGNDIPLWARITAIADVYDALVSPRCYKKAWEPEKALEVLHKDAGSHFDPELVEYFSQIMDTVNVIMERYKG